jgi:hypothetical protein
MCAGVCTHFACQQNCRQPHLEMEVHKKNLHMNIEMHASALYSYMNHWVVVLYSTEQLQHEYRHV